MTLAGEAQTAARCSPGTDQSGHVNGLRLTMTNDRAYDFIISLVVGEPDEVPDIAAILEEATELRT